MRPFDLPLGYKYSTAYAGIRKQEKDDLALIVSGVPAAAAAVFTTNKVQAAPVKLARANMRASKGVCGAILVNAGNANCATQTGDKVALEHHQSAGETSQAPAQPGAAGFHRRDRRGTGRKPDSAKAARRWSTNLSDNALPDVARAILTTDLQPKGASREVTLRRGIVRIAGVTKGSGMIHPRMATTLGFVMTDAVIPQTLLRRMLVRATELSYNRISVDGDTSTNDTLIVLANGASGVRPDPKEMSIFEEALTETLQSLARQIVRDGEGARKLISVEVHGAVSDAAAAAIARAIAISPLVKTAIAGFRSELGTHSFGGRQFGREFRSVDGRNHPAGRQGVPQRSGGALRRSGYESSGSTIPISPSCSASQAKGREARPSGRAISPKITSTSMRITALKKRFVSYPGWRSTSGRNPVRICITAGISFLSTGETLPAQETPPPWFETIAGLAASLSRNDAVGAMEAFDRDAKDYGAIEQAIGALAAQTDVLCAIDPITDRPIGDKPAGDSSRKERDIEVDWYFQLKSQTTAGPTERRRERVHLLMRSVRGKWKILSISPIAILDPIHIS